jgi:MYXO-CTERM domain-containing protein
VKVEAKFAVGEYQIVILSARDSTGLDTWLREEKYKIPKGAAPYLKPYVQGGSKFFVAKVDAAKVKFEKGQAMLSPLRFHYDSEEFNLPIRLGMMNSAGTQDLIVHILALGQRYEVANYPNVTIPTNLDVREQARDRFGEFYAALFDRTLEKNRGAVVTEYAWDAGSCDPCPTPPLEPGELATLGADVLQAGAAFGAPMRGRSAGPFMGGFVLTRLHARYGKDAIGEDLVFKAAPPIAGGREWRVDGTKLEEGAVPFNINNFQARYAIRHPWTGPVACANPSRGVWGGPPDGQQIATGPGQARAALDLAFAPRGKVQLARMVKQDVPEIDVAMDERSPAPKQAPPAGKRPEPKREQKGCATGGAADLGAALLVALFLVGLARRRRDA